MILIQNSLTAENVILKENAESASAVITCLSERLADYLGTDTSTVEKAVLDREQTRSTAFPNGAAIPHCRLPGLDRFGVAVMLLREPVQWDDAGHAVDTVFMIAGPPDNVAYHLRVLANSSQLVDSAAVRGKLRRAPDAPSAHRLIAAAEKALEKRRTQDGLLREVRKDPANGGTNDYLAAVAEGFNW